MAYVQADRLLRDKPFILSRWRQQFLLHLAVYGPVKEAKQYAEQWLSLQCTDTERSRLSLLYSYILTETGQPTAARAALSKGTHQFP
jgi:hypothetical protein